MLLVTLQAAFLQIEQQPVACGSNPVAFLERQASLRTVQAEHAAAHNRGLHVVLRDHVADGLGHPALCPLRPFEDDVASLSQNVFCTILKVPQHAEAVLSSSPQSVLEGLQLAGAFAFCDCLVQALQSGPRVARQ